MTEKGQLLSVNIWIWLHNDIILPQTNLLKCLVAYKKKIPAKAGILHIYTKQKYKMLNIY